MLTDGQTTGKHNAFRQQWLLFISWWCLYTEFLLYSGRLVKYWKLLDKKQVFESTWISSWTFLNVSWCSVLRTLQFVVNAYMTVLLVFMVNAVFMLMLGYIHSL